VLRERNGPGSLEQLLIGGLGVTAQSFSWPLAKPHEMHMKWGPHLALMWLSRAGQTVPR